MAFPDPLAIALRSTLVLATAVGLLLPWGAAESSSLIDEPRYRAAIDELLASPQGRVLLEAYLALSRDQLPEVSRDDLLHGALLGMLQTLDGSYVRLLSPAELEAEAQLMRVEPLLAALDFEEVGYLRVPSFSSERLGPAVERAVAALLSGGAEALILDLRGNPGGLIRSGLAVLDLFISEEVLGFRSKRSDAAPIAFANPGAFGFPVVVLIDRETASTAELVAGALQSLGRAVVYGEASAGKGVGQTRVALSDGRALELVSFRWSLPDGRSVDEGGLEPDLSLDPSGELGDRRPVFGELELDPVLRAAVRDLWRVLRSDPGPIGSER